MPSTRVQSGESLWSIAKRKKIDWLSLVAANPQISDPNLIRPGQQIRLPTGRASEASRSRAAVRTGISPTGRAEDVGRYALDQQGSLVQTNLVPTVAQPLPAPEIRGPLSRPTRGGRASQAQPAYLSRLDEQAQAGLSAPGVQPFRNIPGPETRPTLAGRGPRRLTREGVTAITSRAGTAAARGAQSILSAAASNYLGQQLSNLPQPAEGIARGAAATAGTWGQELLRSRGATPTTPTAGQIPMNTPASLGVYSGAPQLGGVPGSGWMGMPAQRATQAGRAVTGTRPIYQSPDVQQLQEQNWDRHIETVALQLLTGQGFPTYTMSRIVDDPRFRDTILAYFAAAGVDVSGLTTTELLDVMGYKYVDGDIWYRSDNGAATGGVGTFGGTTYFGGFSGGGGGRGSMVGGGGVSNTRTGAGFSYGLIDWRISA